MEITLKRAGMFTTVQDAGRTGHRALGVPLGGAVDSFALRVANLLVGNAEGAAVLEATLVGPEIAFSENALIAVAGARFSSVPSWQPFWVSAGQTLRLGPCIDGCRSYLAIAGGIDVPIVLGSRSTNVRARFGGYAGRLLSDGDRLSARSDERKLSGHWQIDRRLLPEYSSSPTLRILPGAECDEFQDFIEGGTYEVTSQSDRVGIRLAGNPLLRKRADDLLSTAVTPGTMQVPPDGQPIVLLADAQTIGGYPKIAHVITVDLPLAAQVRPGDSINFARVSLEEAHRLWFARERALAILAEGLARKIG